MEEDDDFGDLYSDVLQPLHSSSASQPLPLPVKSTQQLSSSRRIDLNVQDDDEETLYGASKPNLKFNFISPRQDQVLVSKSNEVAQGSSTVKSSVSHLNLNLSAKQDDEEVEKGERLADGVSTWASDLLEPSAFEALESIGIAKSQTRRTEDPNLIHESGINVVEERDEKDEILMDKRENFDKFDIEEAGTGPGGAGSEPVIPGLSIPGVSDSPVKQGGAKFVMPNEESGEADGWESDSEDDLQIVLNDNHPGPMAMDTAGAMGSDDEDEDGDPLVIVADSEPVHQPMEEQEWGEDAAQTADGERKELGDAGKMMGGVAAPPKIGYSNHAYHPYHSQFKYVRPGAAPIPGAAPVGPGAPSSQVRPPVNIGPVAGRGRADWRPTGMKSASIAPKSFHPMFWGSNASGRGSGSGLDFTLPSHKTIFEVDVDSFEEKPWRLPGIDMSDFFNFGLNEDSWKDYCKQLEQLRLEATMQSKIHVYESGRTEKEYDPDLPPELAAAVGIHDISSENANLGKMDVGQSDIAKGSARVRTPLPTGRPIQVESGHGERLPSIDTRPPRVRDSDAIIEIVLQDFAEDDSCPRNDFTEQPENDISMEDIRGVQKSEEDVAGEDAVHLEGFPRSHKGKKREPVETIAPFMHPVEEEGDGMLSFRPEILVQCSPDSRGQTSAYSGRDVDPRHEERLTKRRAGDGSANIARGEGTFDNKFLDKQRGGSVESIGGKHSPQLSSPLIVGNAEEPDMEHVDGLHKELVVADGSSGMDRDETVLERNVSVRTCKDENLLPSLKKPKLSYQVEHPSPEEIDDGGDLKAGRSNETSKARSGSSRHHQKLHDSVDEEVQQRSPCIENSKGFLGEDKEDVRRKGLGMRHEMQIHQLVEKDTEDSYSRRDRDPQSRSANFWRGKTEGVDKQKERESFEGARQQQDTDSHSRRVRAEETRKRDSSDEMGSRQRYKVQESEKMDKGKHIQLKKHLANSNSGNHRNKDVGSRHRERDSNLKRPYENMDELNGKRRKEEVNLRRDSESEKVMQGQRENKTRQKPERDLRKRDDQVKTREDDCQSFRHKEDNWTQRERDERQRDRDEWHRIKPSREESLLKQEREEGRGIGRTGRAAEDKAWVTHARMKDEYKGSDRDYQYKDIRRHSEQIRRRDRDREDGSLSQQREREGVHGYGSHLSSDDRRLRQKRKSILGDHAASSDNSGPHDKKQKENPRKSQESEGRDKNSTGPSKRRQEDQNGQINEPVTAKGRCGQGNNEHASDDNQQDSKRGRSKLERWTSHNEWDFGISSRSSSSSLKLKEINIHNNGGSSLASKLPDGSSKSTEPNDNPQTLCDLKNAGDPETKTADKKSLEDKHLDTVAKLKKRSERFKLPMPSEKEVMVVKKLESEPLPSAQSESLANSEIKLERPTRKRRWTSN
ncbi:hypothetical protein NMG60_11005162 [Bertholletia excelsa]